MIEQILQAADASTFDFRQFAHPNDPLSELFEDWVPYYRMKNAICEVLSPNSILEIGVRYGYSAVAFLEARPRAKFIGLDNRSEEFGGVGSAAWQWADNITKQFNATFVHADSQKLNSFPGQQYDLIHVDGQQDEEGMYRDLGKAMDQAKYILLDGYTWTAENYHGANRFLLERRKDLAYYSVIPGYAGELILRVSDPYRERARLALEGLAPNQPTLTPQFDRMLNAG